jgi:flagellar basal-body rod modification protein FlgD
MIDTTNTTNTDPTADPLAGGIGGTKNPTSDQFLKLLVVQLQHQDPLNPVTDSNFTAQLAQFSSLEQLTKINSNLLGLGGIQEGLVNAQALNLLDKTVLVSSDTPVAVKNGAAGNFLVSAPAEATSVKVEVRDASGKLVRTIDVPAGAGRRSVSWDGKDDRGNTVADGDYKVSILATDPAGKSLGGEILVALKIDSVSFAGGVVKLGAGDREVPFDQIVEIQAN